MACRFDKFVWSVRLAKTRSQAAELISKGKIKLNESKVKPAKEPKVGDVVQVVKSTATFSFKIIELLEKRVGAKLVENYVLDVTTPEELEKARLYALTQAVYRDNGSGKPSKKDRRDINDFLDF